ncbi:Bug family tripartite tricarboxylate transporter substrate binding protein [Hydrogenophaga sp. BPS33]|uniref:Bug family tripartite tricarboxylate transporter substrate binding protein n=1 Tax=Hydrogenophaga sp. BPS33 TaxID=2651974 RepID=UPI00131F90D8|nr:tripartite tricarboxylate transporter substrate binding protein [Hydrogenophaga sp. BPS33]QHE84736.1 tripartite tricarboxylate transporter substrate binding protein [Hydrogenophaga sp. BPS33]
MSFSRRAVLRAASLTPLYTLALHAGAQQFPARPIKLVVPYPPGGTFDAISRLLADKLSVGLGQPVIVENKPGANGMIALSSVAKSTPDGYTLVVTGTSLVLNFASFKTVSYRLDEFTAVGGLVDMPLAIGVNPAFPAKTFQELVAAIHAAPDKYSISTSGTIEEIILAELRKTANLKFQTIPYPGAAPSLNAVVGGIVPIIITAAGAAQQLHNAGKVRLLAITGGQRLSALPGVPTIAELGIPIKDMSSWCGVLAPAKTPDAVVRRLSDEVQKAMQSPEVGTRIAALSMAVNARDAAQFSRFTEYEASKWKQAAAEAGIKPE